MRVRTLFAITLTMFALPALAAEMPTAPQPRAVAPGTPQMLPPIDANGNPDVSVSFGVCILKVPVGFCEKVGVKLTGNTVLTDDNMRRLLEAAQASPETSAMQLPKITADDGQTATVRNCEQRLFVTGIDATKVKGATVLVPKNTSVELGDTLTVCGQVARDAQTVTVKASLMRVRVAGSVELIPVTTRITPVFEGGSQGQPVPFTQFIQVPDIKTEKVEKNVVLPADGTIVLGSWKETAELPVEQPKRNKLLPRKEKSATEYEVVAFATVRVLRNEELAVAPMPRELPARVTKVFEVLDLVVPGKLPPDRDSSAEYRKNSDNLVKLVMQMVRPYSWTENGGRGSAEYFNIGCALVVTNTPEAVQEVADLLETLRRLNTPCAVAPMPREAGKVRTFQLRNIAAADAAHALATHLKGKNLEVRLTFDVPTNTVFVQADPALGQRICAMLAALDKTPPQVMMQATVIQVPRGFMETYGLTDGGDPSAKPCVLSPRELRMFTAILRHAKEKGELEVLSRPQLQVADNQTGFVQVGQSFPVKTAGLVKTAGGMVVVESKVEFVPTGFSMRLTPRVSPDGKSVLLRTEGQLTTVMPAPATRGNPEDPKCVQMPAFNTQQVSFTTEVRDGDTLVVAMVGGETGGRSFIGAVCRCCVADKFETLVIITPHIIALEPVRPAAGWGQK